MNILRVGSILLLLSTLVSCDGVLEERGHVYDNTTMRPIDSVQVILVLGKNDTILRCKPPFSVDSQLELHRENYNLSFTDTAGYFSISSGLIGSGLGDLKAIVIFTKRGYAPAILTTPWEPSQFDSVQMQLLQ